MRRPLATLAHLTLMALTLTALPVRAQEAPRQVLIVVPGVLYPEASDPRLERPIFPSEFVPKELRPGLELVVEPGILYDDPDLGFPTVSAPRVLTPGAPSPPPTVAASPVVVVPPPRPTFVPLANDVVDHGTIRERPTPVASRPISSREQVWGGVDYLLWRIRRAPGSVPLVTTGDPTDPKAGYLPGSRVVLDTREFGSERLHGGRATFGFWTDPDASLGFEFTGFLFGERTDTRSVASDARGAPFLARPVHLPSGPAIYVVSDPGFASGSLRADLATRLGSAELNAIAFVTGNDRLSWELLAGARVLELNESLDLRYRLRNYVPVDSFGTVIASDSVIDATDAYRTRNRFYGGQIGTRVEWNVERFSLGVSGKLGLGMAEQRLTVDGATTLVQPGVLPARYRGGMLATAANIGQASETRFAMIPELGVTLGWRIAPRVKATVGYNLLVWTDVLRPGHAIDRCVNPVAVPLDPTYTPNAPVTRSSPQFLRSDFWSEGLSLGLEFRF